ncbi:MAG: lamin tail domain-containing protein [Anaerolineae bacterium]
MYARLLPIFLLTVLIGLACNLPQIPGLSAEAPPPTAHPPTPAGVETPPPTAEAGPVASTPPPPTPTSDDPRDQVAVIHIQTVVNGEGAEYVELVNQGAVGQLMDGWRLQGSIDDESPADDYKFPPGFVLEPGATVKIHSGAPGAQLPPGDLFWTEADIWADSGETIYLLNTRLDVVDEFTWPPPSGE